MEQHHQKILEQYQLSDFTVRLNMYLSYPELRHEFIRIDSEYPDTADLPLNHIPFSGRFSRLLDRLAACLF